MAFTNEGRTIKVAGHMVTVTASKPNCTPTRLLDRVGSECVVVVEVDGEVALTVFEGNHVTFGNDGTLVVETWGHPGAVRAHENTSMYFAPVKLTSTDVMAEVVQMLLGFGIAGVRMEYPYFVVVPADGHRVWWGVSGPTWRGDSEFTSGSDCDHYHLVTNVLSICQDPGTIARAIVAAHIEGAKVYDR